MWKVKESPSGRKKMISDWNIDLYKYKGPEKLRNDNYVVEHNKDFMIWRPFKDIWLFKAKWVSMHYRVYTMSRTKI